MALFQHPKVESAVLDPVQPSRRTPAHALTRDLIFEPVASDSQAAPRAPSLKQPFANILTAGFFVLELCSLLRHAMWRDEMQVWLLAQHSHSFQELLYNKRYEGHPAAWYALVYLASRVSSNPLAMQLLHLVIASGTVYVLARYAPFTQVQKALLACGYFFLFEYATISRCYALGVLLLFCFCAVFYAGVRKRYVTLAFLLAMLAETSAYGAIIAAALALFVALEFLSEPGAFLWKNFRRIVAPAFIFAAGMALAASQMVVPHDSRFAAFLHFPLDRDSIETTLDSIWKGFVPIPELTNHFWNTNLVHEPLLFWLSLIILTTSLLFFARNWALLTAYSCGVGTMLIFRHIVKWGNSVRHDGHFFILFVACVWLAAESREKVFSSFRVGGIFARFFEKRQAMLTALFAIHAIVGIGATAEAFARPFSESKVTAQFLKTHHLDKMFIVGETDSFASSVVGYLDRAIYYYDERRMGSFVLWARPYPPKESVLDVAANKAAERREDVVAILNERPSTVPTNVHELASFEGGIVGDENYYLYLIQYKKSPEAALQQGRHAVDSPSGN